MYTKCGEYSYLVAPIDSGFRCNGRHVTNMMWYAGAIEKRRSLHVARST